MKILSYLQRKTNTGLKTLLVDDHAFLLEGVAYAIKDMEDVSVSHTAGTVAMALDYLATNPLDLLITDYSLPDGTGLDLIRKAKNILPELKIIMLSMHDEAHLVKEVLKEGVDAYILKKDSLNELSNAVHAIKNNKMYLSSDINSMLVQSLSSPDTPRLLTQREREVLQLISEEYSNKNIGEKLFISERTVETHRKNIFRKTQTNSVVGLLKFAYANNLIAP